MKRHTTLDLDSDLLEEAARALGTRRTTETVHRALEEAVKRRRRAWLAEWDAADLSPELVDEMRRPRIFRSND